MLTCLHCSSCGSDMVSCLIRAGRQSSSYREKQSVKASNQSGAGVANLCECVDECVCVDHGPMTSGMFQLAQIELYVCVCAWEVKQLYCTCRA